MKKTVCIFCAVIALTAQTAAAEHVCVNVSKANLRTGPGTDYMKSWEVGKYMPFEKIGISLCGSWYAVKDVDDDTHWIYKKLVAEDCSCAVATGDNIAVRTGPGLNHAKTRLGRVSKYYCFKVLGRKGSWAQVRDALGNEGWMHTKNLWIP